MRRLIFIAIGLLLVLPRAAQAMTFSFCGRYEDPIPYAKNLCLSGEIRPGDTERFLSFIRSDPVNVYMAWSGYIVDSSGGDIDEAIKLAQVLKALYVNIGVQQSCSSSCLLLYLAGALRTVTPTGRLGVHRPYFTPERFRNVPVKEADAAYSAMQKQFHDYLSAAGFPESLFEKLMAASSKDIRWLSREELRLIGPMPPYLQERFLAACSLEIDTPRAAEKTLDCLNQF